MRYKTLFRVLLKVIGVMIFAIGVSDLLMNLSYIFLTFFPSYSPNLGPIGWRIVSFVKPLVEVAAGAYLFFGGKWIADLAIPGNRPYCHECGYDLTGAVGDRCTECGTAFRPPTEVR